MFLMGAFGIVIGFSNEGIYVLWAIVLETSTRPLVAGT